MITGTFIFQFGYKNNIVPPPTDFALYVPILNENGSFVLNTTYTNVNNLITMTVAFEYTENNSVRDGLMFSPWWDATIINFYRFNVSSVAIIQFGGVPLCRDGGVFGGLKDLVFNTLDAPTILPNTSLNGTFSGCDNFNSPVNHWDISNAVGTASMFAGALVFNQPLNNWNMSNVTNMSGMFQGTQQFNQPLSSWDTSSVTNLYRCFMDSQAFNQDLSAWDVGNVTLIEEMFRGATAFNQPLNWVDTSKFNTIKSAFKNATAFNQSLPWNISLVTSLESVFEGATSFNTSLAWNTSAVTTMLNTFRGATSFNQPLNSWVTSSVTDMTNTFRGATSFNQPLNNWNTSNVVNMPNMFRDATIFNQDLSGWNVSNVLEFTAFNFDSALSTTNLPPFNPITGSLEYSFTYTGGVDPPPDFSLYLPVSNTYGSFATPYNVTVINTSNFVTVSFQFSCTLNQITYSTNDDGFTFKDVASFYANNTIELTITSFGFIPFSIAGSQFKGLTSVVLNNNDFMTILPNTSLSQCFRDVASLTSTTAGNAIRLWKTENVYDMSYMFSGCSNLQFSSSDDYWNMVNVTNTSHMFENCTNFSVFYIAFDLRKVTDMSYMFSGATSYNFTNRFFDPATGTTVLSPTWYTYAATNMAGMFQNAISFNLSLNDIVTSSVTDMSNMFQGATAYNQPMNSWDVNSVTDMSLMFQNATSFNQPLNNWDVSSVTNMSSMFQNASSFNQPLSDWNVSSVTNMSYMFTDATSYNQDMSNWNVLNVTDSTDFSTGSAVIPTNEPSLPAPFQYSFQYTGGGSPPDFSLYVPIINTGGSFTTLNTSYTNVANLITVTVNYVYTYNNNDDGLTFEMVSGFYVNNTTNLTVIQFGSIPLSKSGGLQFADLTDLTFTAIDRPFILSGTSLALCFQGCTNFNSSLSNWVTTNVVNMSGMFFDASSFNQDISGWNTGLVTNMTSMFQNATVFNQNLSGWNVALVTQYNNFSTGSALTVENLPNFNTGPVICFKSGSKILCVINGKEEYVVIDHIQPGTHVKTRLHGLKRVMYVGRSVIINRKSNALYTSKDSLYTCTKSNYPELFEDLVITGCHSILVDSLSEEEREGVIGLLRQVCVTEDKYRLPACLDKRAVKFEEVGIFTIYHIALENEDIMKNYGIIANGLLVESCSLRFLKELSKMDITGPNVRS